MIEKETEHRSAGFYAWVAAKDASMNHAINASRFTDSQKLKAEKVKLALELVYSANQITITNCKKWIRVKAHNAIVKDKKSLKLLEDQWSIEGITKVFTPQGVVYHVV